MRLDFWLHQLVSGRGSATICTWLVPVSKNSLIGGKARSKTSFQFNVQTQPLLETSGASLAKSPTWTLGLRVVRVAENHLVVHLPVSLTPERKEAVGIALLMCYISFMRCAGRCTFAIFRSVKKHYCKSVCA